MKLIDKDALVTRIKKLKMDIGNIFNEYDEGFWEERTTAFDDVICALNTLEVKEVSEELAETYIKVFEKKFPILPTLKGKQLDKFKNFLNRCRQIFVLQEFGIHPVQAKLFEKLALLWAAWGAENLQGIGQVEGEADVVKEVDLEKEIDGIWNPRFNLGWDDKSLLSINHEGFTSIAKHFFELGLKAQKGE